MMNICEQAQKLKVRARGGMVDAADLKAIDLPIKSITLYDYSPFVHGRFSARSSVSQTKFPPQIPCNSIFPPNFQTVMKGEKP